ncbi:MAG TPA: OmpA family protein [Gemmatimonadales bacterium]|jgi:outer membrane protein OmpA-like peptidoglycan-associated protein|nr:OmpA family protein [Gemmatimonadales bacterium]
MRDQILKSVRTLAAFLPMLALAQPMAAQSEGRERDDSWEWSAGAGLLYTDGALRGFLASRGYDGAKPSRLAPAVAVRVGYNVSNHWGFSIGTSGAKASSVKYLTPFAAATYTANLNARFSPFLTLGTQFTRITGENGRKTHPTWGTHLGVGIRKMMSPNLALRVEGRMGMEHYADLPGAKTAYNSLATIGFSYFTAGRRAPPEAIAAAPCPVCARARVDTVRIYVQPPPPPPRRCEHGVAPAGAPVDQYGCLVLRDTLLLEAVHFDFDKSVLTPTATPILDRVAESMLAHPEAFFEIAGHTDSVGTFAYNFLLSARRAAAVRDYLIRQGVPAYKMTAVGYGEGFPIAPNATVEGRALNRRGIELRVKKP